MNIVQQNLYQMLKELDTICRENDIIYYLAGGTALGAVRCEGFLPWDDDIDLYITRKNWLKLEKVLAKSNFEARTIVSKENTKYYCNPIPRYVNTNTTLIYKSQMLCGKAAGQHIELLIMDPLPTSKKEADEYKKLLLVYTELLTPYFVVNRAVINAGSYFDYDLYNHYYKMSRRIGLNRTIKKIEKKLFSYSEDDCEDFCMRWGVTLLVYGKKMFGVPRLQKFEDQEFYVAEHAEDIFRVAYGDNWMYVPQIEEQVTHNSFLDTNTPFEYYVNLYMPKINRPRVFKAYKKNKRHLMKTLIERETFNKMKLDLKRTIIKKHVEYQINSRTTSALDEAVSNKDVDILREVFGEMDQFLFGASAKKYEETININEEWFYYYLYMLMLDGCYWKVLSLDNRFKHAGNEFKNPKVIKLVLAANTFRELSILVYDKKDLNAAAKKLNQVDANFKDSILYKRFYFSVLVELNKDNEAKLEKLKEEIEKDNVLKADAEIKKALGDIYFYLKNTKKAFSIYEKVRNNTRNGILLLDLYKKTGDATYLVLE